MYPFDREYLERREKQIRERYTMRAVSGGMGLTSVMCLLVIVFILLSGSATGFAIPLGIIMLSTGAISVITFLIASAEAAADKAIHKEREQLAAIYAQQAEKPKRNATLHLSDDGELLSDDEIAVQTRTKTSNNHNGSSGA